jgi:hypothetical protein
MTLLNLGTGKYEWQTRLGEPDEGINRAPTEAFLDFRADTLLVGWDAYLGTYRVSDGVRLSRHGLHHDSATPNCQIRDLLGDRLVGRCLGPNMPDRPDTSHRNDPVPQESQQTRRLRPDNRPTPMGNPVPERQHPHARGH